MLAAGIVQDKFAREAEGGVEETTVGGYFYTAKNIIVKTTVLVHLTILKYGLKQPTSRQNNFDGLI